MFSAFQKFGRLGAPAGAPWTERALFPQGASSPGLWIDPSYVASCYQDSAGTTALSTVGTVLDSSNPVGLVLDRKGGATSVSDPGLHLSQSTSAARPVASARVNLLTYSEDFSNAVWDKSVITPTATSASCPLGNNATEFTFSADGGSGLAKFGPLVAGTVTYYLKYDSWRWFEITTVSGSASRSWVDLQNGVLGATVSPNHIGLTATPVGNGWVRISYSLATSITELYLATPRNGNGSASDAVGSTGAKFFVSPAQFNLGSTALPYQRVGAASDYTTTGFPVYTKFDGTDDALASATFAAGTLTSSMDCLIAVRRDSTANAVCGLYESVAEANKVFGIAESGSGSGCVGSGAGTPTVWVDGTQLTGGTAVTRGTLHTALTAGAWHILELRGLDLSTWTAAGYGKYTSYILNGALGKIELFASGQDSNRDKARKRMADYFGVTLP